MRSLRAAFLATGVLTCGFIATTGCDTVDAAFDCEAVCTRYHDCYDANYDVGACRDRCRTASANDSTIRAKADACEACIGDKSCLSATFVCGGDCGPVLAQ